MSPPDSGESRPDNHLANWPRAPLADASAEAAFAELLAKDDAMAIWALADGRPLWWNQTGGMIFGLPPSESPAGDISSAIERAKHSDRPWLERRRLSIGPRPCLATLQFSKAHLVGGGQGLVAVAVRLDPPLTWSNGSAIPPPPLVSTTREPSMATYAGDTAAPLAGNSKELAENESRVSRPATRRLTWQTDATGRLLAGPGMSLSQALGWGAPMQPVLLSELFAGQSFVIEEITRLGGPLSGVPVQTVEGTDGVVFTGSLFGAPILDGERRAMGYRGFLAVSDVQHTQSVTPHHQPPRITANAPPSGGEKTSATASSLASATTAGRASEGERAADEPSVVPTGVAAMGLLQASIGALAMPLREPQSEAIEIPGAHLKLVEPPARPSNVIALRLPNTDPARIREAEAPALSPAERDAFADIARALGASWSSSAPQQATLPSPADDPTTSTRHEAIAKEAGNPIEPPPADEAEDKAPPSPLAPSDDVTVAGSKTERTVDRRGFSGGILSDLVAIIDRLPVGIVVHRDGVAVALNKTLLDLLGHGSIDEFEAHGGIEKLFVEPGEKETAHSGVAIRSRDGEIIAVDARCQAIKWNGESATLLSLRRSHTSQTKALEASYQVELDAKQAEIDDLRTILEGAIDGVVTIDALGRILAMNHTAERLFGYGTREIAGEALAILVAPEAHHLVGTVLASAKEMGRASHVEPQEVTGREREGRRIPLSMRLFGAGANRTSARFYAVFADLTAAKNSEAALIEARVSAERSTAQKSEFLAKVSHEIRTPLNSIVGFADIIAEERFGPLANERYKEYLRDIRASGTHIISLVNDLLDLSKIEAGRMELAFTNVSLNAEVSGAVALIQAEAARSRVLMRQSLAQSLPAIVADQRSVKQIVLNILSNAVKFTEPGGQVIVSTAFSDKGEAILRVRDTGIGMSERELAEAMEPFRQFATTQRPGGSGLGLSLTKALVKANKANISISSATNEGTLVEIVFPKESVIAI